MKSFRAPRKTGDKTGQQKRVQSSKAKASSPQKVTQISDSEGPTELGLVWPDKEPSNPWWPDKPCHGKDVIFEDKSGNGKDVMEQESPRFSDYESEGFFSRRCERALGEAPRKANEKFSDGFKLLALARKRRQQERASAVVKKKDATSDTPQKQKEEAALQRTKVDLQAN